MKNIMLITASILLLSGCANMNSIYRTANINRGLSPIIDAKQRAIITSNITHTNGKDVTTSRRVCAEPSPDAMSVLAASGGFNASVADKGSAMANLATSESGANIGIRTHSIQLLRDSFFRTCEAYLNDGIDEIEYALQLRRFQTSMIALITIEQLTGVVKSPSVVLTASSSKDVGDVVLKLHEARKQLVGQKTTAETTKATLITEIAELDTNIIAVKTTISDKEADKKTLDTNDDGNIDPEADGTIDATKQTKWNTLGTEITAEEEKLKGFETELETKKTKKKTADGEITSATSLIESLDVSIKNAELGNLKTTASGVTILDTSRPNDDGQTREKIADVVQKISLAMINKDYGPTRCFDYMKIRSSSDNITVQEQELFDICNKIISNTIQAGEIQYAQQQLQIENARAKLLYIQQQGQLEYLYEKRKLEEDKLEGAPERQSGNDTQLLHEQLDDLIEGFDSNSGIGITFMAPPDRK